MSTFTKLTWPVQDVAAVCALQNLSAAGNLVLNGTLFDPSIPNQVSFARSNMIRSISITSVNNLSGVNFIIQGIQNEAFITETLAGPNNNTVYGTKHYDIIVSVTVSASVTGVSVGTGDSGYFPLLIINPNTTNINYAASILLPPGSGITYSLLQTLDSVSDNFISFDDQINNFFECMGLTDETTSQLESTAEISNFILLKIKSSTHPITDTFKFIFIQQ